MPENSNTEQKHEAFIMLPKKLLTDERYSGLSPISVMIYSALADRASLSQKNGWIDDDGRVFIYFAINEMAKLVGCGKDRVFNSYKQLEKYGIIERKRQGQGKPAKIFVNDFAKTEFKTSENPNSGLLKNRTQDFGKSEPNNTYINNNYFNNTNLSIVQEGYDEMRLSVEEQVNYDYLCQVREKACVDELITVITDTLFSPAQSVRIGGQSMPKSVVDSRLRKLDEEHICYVIDCFDGNKTEVRNIRSYLLTALYNAPSTIDSYYRSLVNRDLNLTG
ncbi:MAG: replication initiator protein A [Clostridia bacterium]|nr:replication initiator protein A [Clostridia bacterium]